jgi:hypothetical protein
MNKLILMTLVVVFTALPLIGVDTIKGLGSYFGYLIPDTEQDVKLFPDRLTNMQSRYVELATKQNGNSDFYVSTSPIQGKITTRHDLQYYSHGSSSVDEVGTRTMQYQNVDFENYFSCKIGKRNLGILAAYSSENNESERIRNGEHINYYDHFQFSDIIDSNLDGYGYSLGLSTSLGSTKSTSISAIYSSSERDQISSDIYCHEDWQDNILDDERSYSRKTADKYDAQNLSIALIHDSQKTNYDIRYFGSFLYQQAESNIYEEVLENRTYYDSTLITDERNEYELTDEFNDNKNYSIAFGIGLSKQTAKIDMYSAAKLTLNYTYSEIDFSQYEFITDYDYFNSTTVGDTISTNTSLEKKSYGSGITIPVGFKFKPYKWLNIFGSIVLTAKYTFSDYEDDDFQNWTSKTGQNISFAILPYENVEIGVYYMSDFADYRNWEIHVKYCF